MEKKLKVGFCRLDITPHLGIRLSGYYSARVADGMYDPLYVNAIAFDDGENKAVMLVCDLVGVFGPAAYTWSVEIANKVGLPPEALFFSHTHTHTGPVVTTNREPSDPEYDAWLQRRLCDAAVLAMADCTPVTQILGTEGMTNGLTYCRRYLMKNGTYKTNPEYCDPDIVAPACKADESFRLIRFVREEGEEITLVNFQCHPDCIGGTKISADYPGFFRNKLEANRPGVKSIFINGAEGQLTAIDRRQPKSFVPGGKPVLARKVGEGLADFVLEVYDDVRPIGGDAVRFGQNTFVATTKFDPARIDDVNRILKLHEEGRDDEIEPAHLAKELVAEAFKLKRLEAQRLKHVSMVASAITVGDIGFIGFPGEPFCEIGIMMRQRSPYPMTFICHQTNGHNSYFPTAESYDQDGYEPRNNQFVKGTGEGFAEKCLELLERLRKE